MPAGSWEHRGFGRQWARQVPRRQFAHGRSDGFGQDLREAFQIMGTTLAQAAGRTVDRAEEIDIAGVAEGLRPGTATQDDDRWAIDRARQVGEKPFQSDEHLRGRQDRRGLAQARLTAQVPADRQGRVGGGAQLYEVEIAR